MELTDLIWPAIGVLSYLIWIYPSARHSEPDKYDETHRPLKDTTPWNI